MHWDFFAQRLHFLLNFDEMICAERRNRLRFSGLSHHPVKTQGSNHQQSVDNLYSAYQENAPAYKFLLLSSVIISAMSKARPPSGVSGNTFSDSTLKCLKSLKRAHPDEKLVFVSARVHPLIRDSASVESVPFHVEWGRDITINGSHKRMGFGTIFLSVATAFAIILYDISRVARNFERTWNTVMPLILVSMFLPLMLTAPLRALLSRVRWMAPLAKSATTSTNTREVTNATDTINTIEAGEDVPRWCDLRWTPQNAFKGDVSWMNLSKHTTCDTVISTSILGVTRANFELPSDSDGARLPGEPGVDSPGTPPPEAIIQNHGQTSRFANRESSKGHWFRESLAVESPVVAVLPVSGEYAMQMSLHRVMFAGNREHMHEVYDLYIRSGDLRLAADRIIREDVRLGEWLDSWQNCLDDLPKERPLKDLMKKVLAACSTEDPSRWGPAIPHLESKFWVLNKEGEGVLLMPEHLLSTIVPRYGHRTTVGEVAYLSAKGACGDKRYYRARVYLFWAATIAVFRTTMFVTAAYESVQLVGVVSLGVLILWLSVGRSAFNLDVQATLTGRVEEGCILAKAGGCKVTVNMLAKWNANVSSESAEWLNSYHTPAHAGTGVPGSRPMAFNVLQRAGGLMISTGEYSGLALCPWVQDLGVWQFETHGNLHSICRDSLRSNFLVKVKDIVSKSPYRIGMCTPQIVIPRGLET